MTNKFVFDDIGFVVLATPGEYTADFNVYEISGHEGTAAGPMLFAQGNGYTTDLGDADIFVHGTVKWDGCADWLFNENAQNVMLHGCSRDRWAHLGEVLVRCWDAASGLVERWDQTLNEEKPTPTGG